MKCIKRSIALLLMLSVILTIFGGCDFGDTDSGEADTVLGNGSTVLRIISGSENAELEPILEEFAKQENIRIEMTYQGSLDIMRLLGEEEIPYDAVWPASSLWLTVGDTEHRVKHAESISITPVAVSYTHLLFQKENGGFPVYSGGALRKQRNRRADPGFREISGQAAESQEQKRGRRLCGTPVSYTHLDVYKRQWHGSGLPGHTGWRADLRRRTWEAAPGG